MPYVMVRIADPRETYLFSRSSFVSVACWSRECRIFSSFLLSSRLSSQAWIEPSFVLSLFAS